MVQLDTRMTWLTRPVKLGCETVNLCNNDCVFCGYGSQSRTKGHMGLEVFAKVLRDYSDIGGGYISLTPMVGELFLDRHLMERLRLVSEFPKIQGLIVASNVAMAHRFDDAELQFIIGSFKKFHISVYGLDEEEHFALTRKRTYEKMLKGIRRALLFSSGNVKLTFRLAKARPPDAIQEWFRTYIAPFLWAKGGSLGQHEIINVLSTYMNWGRLDTSVALPFDAKWQPDVVNSEQCAVPKFSHVVLSNGDVAFCHCSNFDNVEELRLGNIHEHSLGELFTSERTRRLWDWKSFGVPEFCRTCTFHRPMSVLAQPGYLSPDSFT
jgi:radical SAM protein with 4Fe4S-binding SPASM domain